jgi:hypothetical protein
MHVLVFVFSLFSFFLAWGLGHNGVGMLVTGRA